MRKILTVGLVALLAVTLTACSSSQNESAQPSASGSSGNWSQAQVNYLQEIYASKMAANDVISEQVYIEIANTVCQGLTQGNKTEALLALLAATAEKNGLPINDRKTFGPTVMAASVAYICPENINALVD